MRDVIPAPPTGRWAVGELAPDGSGPAQADARLMQWLMFHDIEPKETYKAWLGRRWAVIFRYRCDENESFYVYPGTTEIAKRLPKIIRRRDI